MGFLVGIHCQTLTFLFGVVFLSSSLNNISSADAKRSGVKSTGSEGSAPINNSVIPVDYKSFKATWTEVVHINRERWRAKVPKGNMPPGYLPGDLSKPLSTHSKTSFATPDFRCCKWITILGYRFKLLKVRSYYLLLFILSETQGW